MEALKLEATRHSPAVDLDLTSGTFRIVGVSIPENASEFYTPIIEWIRGAMPSIPDGSTFSFSLSYFNSSSLKALYLALTEIKAGIDSGKKIDVQWHVDEEDEFMQEAGETFSEMVDIPLNMVTGSL